jgi:hypothetical protein
MVYSFAAFAARSSADEAADNDYESHKGGEWAQVNAD